MQVFVTVGTTLFDALIAAADDGAVLECLGRLGYRKVIIQIGKGTIEPHAGIREGQVEVSYYRFKPSLADDMQAADLIISHAGAGSIMEALGLRKRLLIMANPILMDNHQMELAKAIEARRYAVVAKSADAEGLIDALESGALASVEATPPPPPSNPFCVLLNDEMGGAT